MKKENKCTHFKIIKIKFYASYFFSTKLANLLQIEMYRIMPLKAISRAWGKFNQLELPVVLRRPLLGLYVWMFDCKVDEAMETELQNYKNLGEFFRRVLKPDIRLISQKEELVRRRKTFKIKKKMFKIYMMLYYACPISK